MAKPSLFKAWILAARPLTLIASCAPVLLGGLAALYAHRSALIEQGYEAVLLEPFLGVKLLLCLCFAALMQIAANFVNDLLDYENGVDGADRIGPKRACAQGWISPKGMRRAVWITIALALCAGLAVGYLVLCVDTRHAGLAGQRFWETMLSSTQVASLLVLMGVASVLACVAYSSHLARRGLGDLLVVVFFGAVPVVGTYMVLTNCALADLIQVALMGAFTIGLMADKLLLANNLRDRVQDEAVGKRTLVVRLGAQRAEALYWGVAWVAYGVLAFWLMQGLLPLLLGWGAAGLLCYGLPKGLWARRAKAVGQDYAVLLRVAFWEILVFIFVSMGSYVCAVGWRDFWADFAQYVWVWG